MRIVAFAFLILTAASAAGGCAAEDITAPEALAADQLELDEPTCGDNVCGPGTYCCNASCGWCVPEGALCLDVVCETPVAE